jgi:hypothetical protein
MAMLKVSGAGTSVSRKEYVPIDVVPVPTVIVYVPPLVSVRVSGSEQVPLSKICPSVG